MPTVELTLHIVMTEKPMTQIANNYTTHHNTRKSRSKSRWAWIGAVFAVVGLIGGFWTIKADAKDNPEPSFLINQYVDEDGVVIKRICFGGSVIVVACTLKCTGDGAGITMLSARQACKK